MHLENMVQDTLEGSLWQRMWSEMKVHYPKDYCSMTLEHCSRVPLQLLPSAARLFPSNFAAMQEHISPSQRAWDSSNSQTQQAPSSVLAHESLMRSPKLTARL